MDERRNLPFVFPDPSFRKSLAVDCFEPKLSDAAICTDVCTTGHSRPSNRNAHELRDRGVKFADYGLPLAPKSLCFHLAFPKMCTILIRGCDGFAVLHFVKSLERLFSYPRAMRRRMRERLSGVRPR